METLINLIIFSLLISNFAKCDGSKVDGKFAKIYIVFLSSSFVLAIAIFTVNAVLHARSPAVN